VSLHLQRKSVSVRDEAATMLCNTYVVGLQNQLFIEDKHSDPVLSESEDDDTPVIPFPCWVSTSREHFN
jgi:hypothetical protein